MKRILSLFFVLIFLFLVGCADAGNNDQGNSEPGAGSLVHKFSGDRYELSQSDVDVLDYVFDNAEWRTGQAKAVYNYEISWGYRKVKYDSMNGRMRDLNIDDWECSLTEEQKNAINEIIKKFGRDPEVP